MVIIISLQSSLYPSFHPFWQISDKNRPHQQLDSSTLVRFPSPQLRKNTNFRSKTLKNSPGLFLAESHHCKYFWWIKIFQGLCYNFFWLDFLPWIGILLPAVTAFYKNGHFESKLSNRRLNIQPFEPKVVDLESNSALFIWNAVIFDQNSTNFDQLFYAKIQPFETEIYWFRSKFHNFYA